VPVEQPTGPDPWAFLPHDAFWTGVRVVASVLGLPSPAFLQDGAFWSWFRTLFAALLGALVGGLFTLWGQARAARSQIAAQVMRDAVEEQRTTTAWERTQDAQARADSLDEARRLHRSFSALHGELQGNDLSVNEVIRGVDWQPRWRTIWTPERSLDLDITSDLIRDEAARAQVQRVLKLLDNARDISLDGWPGATRYPLRTLALNLSALGTKIVAAYLRRDPPPEEYETTMAALEDNLKRFEEWQDDQVRRAEAAAEAREDDWDDEGEAPAPGRPDTNPR